MTRVLDSLFMTVIFILVFFGIPYLVYISIPYLNGKIIGVTIIFLIVWIAFYLGID